MVSISEPFILKSLNWSFCTENASEEAPPTKLALGRGKKYAVVTNCAMECRGGLDHSQVQI